MAGNIFTNAKVVRIDAVKPSRKANRKQPSTIYYRAYQALKEVQALTAENKRLRQHVALISALEDKVEALKQENYQLWEMIDILTRGGEDD
jgi:cell shape-determining protein MreC